MNAIAERKETGTVQPISAPQSDAAALMQMITAAATNPAVDIEKMERLLGMHERLVQREAEKSFNDAMNEAQASMQRIATDANNKQTSSKYATYAALDRVLRPIYTDHGFSLSFDTGDGSPPDCVRVVAHLAHRDGFTKTYHADMPADGKGAKGGDVMTKTHATGAAMTYGMRYLLKMIFNVAIGEDDNDGNDVLPVERISKEQLDELIALADEVGVDKVKFCRYHKIDSMADISTANFDAAKKALEAKRATP